MFLKSISICPFSFCYFTVVVLVAFCCCCYFVYLPNRKIFDQYSKFVVVSFIIIIIIHSNLRRRTLFHCLCLSLLFKLYREDEDKRIGAEENTTYKIFVVRLYRIAPTCKYKTSCLYATWKTEAKSFIITQ